MYLWPAVDAGGEVLDLLVQRRRDAKAIVCDGIRVEKPGDIAGALKRALASNKATVVDVVTSFKPSFRDVTSPLAQG